MIERRRFERVNFFCPVTIAPLSGPIIEARCVDISLGGVGLASRVALVLGQSVTLSFHLKVGTKEVVEHVAGRVIRVLADTDGHNLGIEFVENLHPSRTPVLARKIGKL